MFNAFHHKNYSTLRFDRVKNDIIISLQFYRFTEFQFYNKVDIIKFIITTGDLYEMSSKN